MLAVVTTAYIMIAAVAFEERDLVRYFGDAYRRYMETTPRYFPRLLPRRAVRTERVTAAR